MSHLLFFCVFCFSWSLARTVRTLAASFCFFFFSCTWYVLETRRHDLKLFIYVLVNSYLFFTLRTGVPAFFFLYYFLYYLRVQASAPRAFFPGVFFHGFRLVLFLPFFSSCFPFPFVLCFILICVLFSVRFFVPLLLLLLLLLLMMMMMLKLWVSCLVFFFGLDKWCSWVLLFFKARTRTERVCSFHA